MVCNVVLGNVVSCHVVSCHVVLCYLSVLSFTIDCDHCKMPVR